MNLSKPTIVLASDHAGYELKKAVIHFIEDKGLALAILDEGTDSVQSVDYPDFVFKAAHAVLDRRADVGIIICGTGIGASIAANRFKGIRAALCTDVEMAELARQHNNANILSLGARQIEHQSAFAMVEAFLTTPFSGDERHVRRICKLDDDVSA